MQKLLIVRYCDHGRKPWQLHARIVRIQHLIRYRSNPTAGRTFGFCAAMHVVAGGGKMSRDCCFKCAVNKHKDLAPRSVMGVQWGAQ